MEYSYMPPIYEYCKTYESLKTPLSIAKQATKRKRNTTEN
jgi:hypothetical protein